MTTQRLAERADLYRFGIPSAAIAAISTADQDSQLDSASELALGMIYGRYKGPLVSWADDLRMQVCRIAAYNLLNIRGYNPAAGADVNIKMRNDEAITWLTSVARQEISPNIVGAPSASPAYDSPDVISAPLQGWAGRSVR